MPGLRRRAVVYGAEVSASPSRCGPPVGSRPCARRGRPTRALTALRLWCPGVA